MLETVDGTRKGYKISTKTGLNKRPEQDSPKEDFIFCPDCESLLDNDYESPFAKHYYNDRDNPRSFFNVIIRNHHVYRLYYKLDYELFNTFFYSTIFRASISNHENFKNYSLPKDILEKIRKIIIKELPFQQLPLYVFTCPLNPHPTGNFIGALSYNGNIHFIGINEYILILDLSSNKIFKKFFKGINNPKYNSVRILTLPYNYWNSWIKETIFGTILDRMYKNKVIELIVNGLILDKLLKQGIIKNA